MLSRSIAFAPGHISEFDPLPPLPESSSTPTHNLALAHELCVELAAVEGKVDVKVDAVEGALGRVHSFKVLLEVLAGKVRRQSHDFFDPYTAAY